MANQVDQMTVSDIQFDEQGLVPAIIQDVQSKAVLMMAYMNEESLQKTLETGETWFWSRSRQELWHKGANSGHTQSVKDMKLDCDGDTLLIFVEPQGPACHNGTYTCFEKSMTLHKELSTQQRSEKKQSLPSAPAYDYQVLSQLIETIAKRHSERPEGAYTTYLFEQGIDKILKKVGEEASEVIIAAKNRDAEELSLESADLLYHLCVLWREQNLGLDQILDVLQKRHTE